MTKTINISVTEADLRRLDDYCVLHNLTRSKFMLEASLEKVYVEDMANGLLMMNKYLGKVKDDSLISDDDRALLERAAVLLGVVQSGQ